MDFYTVIFGIILFAAATMIIYGWGMIRQKNQPGDLMSMLFSKGERKIKRYLDNNEYVTSSDVETMCDGLEAKLPFSRNRAIIKDKRDYADQLLSYMVKTGQLKKEGSKYIRIVK